MNNNFLHNSINNLIKKNISIILNIDKFLSVNIVSEPFIKTRFYYTYIRNYEMIKKELYNIDFIVTNRYYDNTSLSFLKTEITNIDIKISNIFNNILTEIVDVYNKYMYVYKLSIDYNLSIDLKYVDNIRDKTTFITTVTNLAKLKIPDDKVIEPIAITTTKPQPTITNKNNYNVLTFNLFYQAMYKPNGVHDMGKLLASNITKHNIDLIALQEASCVLYKNEENNNKTNNDAICNGTYRLNDYIPTNYKYVYYTQGPDVVVSYWNSEKIKDGDKDIIVSKIEIAEPRVTYSFRPGIILIFKKSKIIFINCHNVHSTLDYDNVVYLTSIINQKLGDLLENGTINDFSEYNIILSGDLNNKLFEKKIDIMGITLRENKTVLDYSKKKPVNGSIATNFDHVLSNYTINNHILINNNISDHEGVIAFVSDNKDIQPHEISNKSSKPSQTSLYQQPKQLFNIQPPLPQLKPEPRLPQLKPEPPQLLQPQLKPEPRLPQLKPEPPRIPQLPRLPEPQPQPQPKPIPQLPEPEPIPQPQPKPIIVRTEYSFNNINGISNIGNSCFFNASVQLIFNNYFFVEELKKMDIYKNDINYYFSNNMKYLNGNKLELVNNPSIGLKTSFGWHVGSQEDSSEYLTHFLNNLIKKKNIRFNNRFRYTQIQKYTFKNPTEMITYKCIEKTTNQQINNILIIPVPNSVNPVNLNDLYNNLKKEIISFACVNRNDYNEKKNIDMVLSSEFIFSDIIILSLSLYTNNNYIKNNTKINIPFKWNINNNDYNLIGVVAHSGHSIKGGHYVSYVTRNGKAWYKTNDMHVHEITTNNINCDFIYNDGFTPYVLMYIKSSLV